MKKESLFNTLKTSLEEGIAYYEGKKPLHKFHVPDPAPEYTANRIKSLREKLHVSQPVFALILNVSGKTVKSWEQGLRHPEKVACRLLQILEKQPEALFKI